MTKDHRSGLDLEAAADQLRHKRISRRNVLLAGAATAGATAGMGLYSAYAFPPAPSFPAR